MKNVLYAMSVFGILLTFSMSLADGEKDELRELQQQVRVLQARVELLERERARHIAEIERLTEENKRLRQVLIAAKLEEPEENAVPDIDAGIQALVDFMRKQQDIFTSDETEARKETARNVAIVEVNDRLRRHRTRIAFNITDVTVEELGRAKIDLQFADSHISSQSTLTVDIPISRLQALQLEKGTELIIEGTFQVGTIRRSHRTGDSEYAPFAQTLATDRITMGYGLLIRDSFRLIFKDGRTIHGSRISGYPRSMSVKTTD